MHGAVSTEEYVFVFATWEKKNSRFADRSTEENLSGMLKDGWAEPGDWFPIDCAGRRGTGLPNAFAHPHTPPF